MACPAMSCHHWGGSLLKYGFSLIVRKLQSIVVLSASSKTALSDIEYFDIVVWEVRAQYDAAKASFGYRRRRARERALSPVALTDIQQYTHSNHGGLLSYQLSGPRCLCLNKLEFFRTTFHLHVSREY